MTPKYTRRALLVALFATCGLSGALLRAQTVEVTIDSESGADRVSPRRGTIEVDAPSEQNFDAPEFVYLNRNFEELDAIGNVNDPDPDKIAYYRAETVGYTIDGEPVQGAKRSFVHTVKADLKIVWKWDLEYAVFIESATNAPGPGTEPEPGNATGDPSPSIGRTWMSGDSELRAEIDRAVESDAGGFRFQSSGYELSNVRGPAGSAAGDGSYTAFLETGNGFAPSFPDPPSLNDATFAFWGKIDRKLDSARDEVFMVITADQNDFSAALQEVNGEERLKNSMTIGVRPDGRFFVEEVTPSTATSTGIYRELVSLPSALVGFDWHHWAVVFDDFPAALGGAREIRVYRDTALVFQKQLPEDVEVSDPSFRPGIVEGLYQDMILGWSKWKIVGEVFSKTEDFEGGINNLSFFHSALTPAGITAHARGGAGSLWSGEAIINPAIWDGITREPFPNDARTTLRVNRTESFGTLAGERVVTESVTIDDWLRVKWLWDGQVRYRFDATGSQLGESDAPFDSQSFVKVYEEGDPNTPDATFGPDGTVFAVGPDNDVWIDTGRKVEVGAFYRTEDRCFTLANFPSPPGGDLRTLGSDIAALTDTMVDSRAARIFTVASAEAPTEINWDYDPTTFRAEIPLGQSFDPANPDDYLVPELCENGVLSSAGPSEIFLDPVGERPTGRVEGNPLRWDLVDRKLYPVHPGSNRIDWPDQNDPTTSYKIEVVSGFPGDNVPLVSAREDGDGYRIGYETASYDFDTTLAGVSSDFPAFPGAHYRHLFGSNDERQPPTKLDLDSTDEWAFNELSYTEASADGRIDGAAPGTAFTAAAQGRSVLLYSYRPNSDEVADGTLAKEKLAVRVVQSSPIIPVVPGDSKLVLGRRGLELGHGSETSDGAFGIVQRDGSATTSIDPGENFLVDFWLNAADLEADDDPVTILSTGGGKLTVTIDPASSTVTTNYLGITVIHPFTTGGATWKHFIVHVFNMPLFGFNVTTVDFYLDGVRQEQGVIDTMLSGSPPASSTVGPVLTPDSLRLGVGANPLRRLQLDQFRLFALPSDPNPWLTAMEVRELRTVRATSLRSNAPTLQFSFEAIPDGSSQVSMANEVSPSDVGIGPISDDPDTTEQAFDPDWARVGIQEVATRLDSTLDNAGFRGSGYILNLVSNYNANLYDRDAEVGAWGPVFPVNDSAKSALYLENGKELEVAYYENPYLGEPLIHPNVAWPYEAAAYNQVIYPSFGPHARKRIYIASRIGSEGVDVDGRPQEIFDLSEFSDLTIYNQPARGEAGFNPNDEHALVAPSNRAALKLKEPGADIPNNPPLAAFALQEDLNDSLAGGYTSDPWVLTQVNNLVTGDPEMAAYRVRKFRVGDLFFPRPSDDEAANTEGLAYESAQLPENRFLTIDPDGIYDFNYSFTYPVAAGDLLIPPYPLNLVIGNVPMPDAKGGDIPTTDAGGNIVPTQRTLWHDVYQNPWVVSGLGSFFYQYFYPFRGDFYPPTPGTAIGTPVAWVPDGESGATSRTFTGPGETLTPGKVTYDSFWRSSYPKLKRGETLAYQGGEYFNENPGSNGLPALVAMKAAKIVFDVATPGMIIGDDNVADYSARIIRPLDRHESPFTVMQMKDAGFTPADTDKIFIVAERWFFKDAAGSLQKRFYFDSLAEKLVFRGYLNDKDSGDPDLTSGPDPINVLESNVMTKDDLAVIGGLGSGSEWTAAVEAIHLRSQNPMLIRDETPPEFPAVEDVYLAGMMESPISTKRMGLNLNLYDENADLVKANMVVDKKAAALAELEKQFDAKTNEQFEIRSGSRAYTKSNKRKLRALQRELEGLEPRIDTSTQEKLEAEMEAEKINKRVNELDKEISEQLTQKESRYVHLDSFGVGSALVSSPKLLTDPVNGSRYITIAENDDEDLDGAPVSLHIIEIPPDRYRGAIKMIEAADAFSEKVTLQHNGDFGTNTDDLYYEWWIRDAGPLDVVAEEVADDGTLAEVDDKGNSLWQQFLPERTAADLMRFTDKGIALETARHLGLHTIVFEGRPDVTLADKLVLMRYKHRTEVDTDGDPANDWKLVPFEVFDPAAEWEPDSETPFQWAGAANSPQLQADGGKRYVPQLIMGWIKRILDRINPYEARYTDFFSNESPAVYSSQIQIAGAPFNGKVALNSDKNVIENTGLIQLYETVLQRARELSIDNSSNAVSSDGINQALLLAATRLAVLYELLAREAYSDAQDSTITVSDVDDLSSVASYTHAFQNFESDLLHEELALLRGTDFVKSFPVINRLFWNYAKGLGEAAYNVNYRIYDEDLDGFINEDDARALFPQGHGDAWGHFVSALGMHYELLRQPVFSWKSRSELYALMQNVLEVDFLDEKTFAKLAAGKARAGRDIVRGTYRKHYTQDPDGQWQGYTDTDEDRAWGVAEWAHRTGHAAYFDWAVANAILPEDAGDATPINDPENLDRIERLGAIDEIGEVAGGLYEIQVAMDEANGGTNPLGFDADAIAFDIDPLVYDGGELGRKTHFEQVYERAVTAGNNALATLDFASKIGNKLSRLAGDTDSLIVEAFRQDLEYRNRLIAIFGRPYDGTIGFGKIYPEGYEGPDMLLFSYLDRTSILQIIPETDRTRSSADLVRFENQFSKVGNVSDNGQVAGLYSDVFGSFFQNIGEGLTIGTAAGSHELEEAFETLTKDESKYEDFSHVRELELPVRKNSPYAFQALPEWGQRTSYGKIQRILEEELRERIALDTSIKEYIAFLQDFEATTNQLLGAVALSETRDDIHLQITLLKNQLEIVKKVGELVIFLGKKAKFISKEGAKAAAEALPTSVGFSTDATAPGRGGILAGGLTVRTAADATNETARKVFKTAEFLASLLIGDLERDLEKTEEITEIEGLLVQLVSISGSEAPLRNAIGTHIQNLELKRQEYFSAQAEGFRLLREREGFNKILAAKAQKNRYHDMFLRLSRNEAMTKYQSTFDHAARYAWLAAKAYDYETNLDPGHPAAPGALLDQIVKERQLGLWTGGEPQAGQGGLAEILHALNGNFQVLKGQLGLNNPQSEVEKISMRSELFRITPANDDRWEDALKARIVEDLNQMPEFVRYCRPFANAGEDEQPGIVIRFGSHITNGVNFFGNPLLPGDHNYSTANFATKVRGFGVWLENYNAAGLSTTPRGYIVPIGNDYLRTSSSAEPATRIWSIQEQRIPTPFVINDANLKAPGFIPTLNGIDGGFSELRRHGDFRMYHDAGGTVNESELILDSRLVGRSVWNSEWLLIIPGAGLHVNPTTGLMQLAETVSDIKLHFQTYSHQGQ